MEAASHSELPSSEAWGLLGRIGTSTLAISVPSREDYPAFIGSLGLYLASKETFYKSSISSSRVIRYHSRVFEANMVRLLSISIFAIVTSLAAAQKNPQPYYPQPYYPPNWYSDIQSGLRLSKDAEVILRNDTRWAVLTERWTPWSRPETVANIEAATVDDVRNVVGLSHIVLMVPRSPSFLTR